MERLVLEDGAAVKPEDEAFCKRLQQALTDSNKSHGIVTPKEWFPDWGNRRFGKLELFSYYQKTYSVQRFVGFLEFEGRQVLIHPRFDQTGALFRYMMIRLNLMPRLVWDCTMNAVEGSFRAPLVYLFLRQVKEAYAIGVYRQYQTFAYNDAHPKGYLNIPLHIRKNPVENGRVAYSTREYTVENPVNFLILAAWQYICQDPELGDIARKLIQSDPELYMPIKELNHQLNSPYMDRRQVLQIIRATSGPITHHMHLRYERVRQTALMILQRIGAEESAEKSRSRIVGMLFPMDIMWEFFLEKTVLAFDWRKIDVRSQASIDILISERGEALRSMKPDFLLYQKETQRPIAVLDAKYKKIWGNAYLYRLSDAEAEENEADDEYEADQERRIYNEAKPWKDARIREDSFQVMSYMHITGVAMGGILFPVVTEKNILPPKRLQLHRNTKDCILLIPVSLPEETGDFHAYCTEMDARCQLLRDELERLFLKRSVMPL